jgi:hypothetical protein
MIAVVAYQVWTAALAEDAVAAYQVWTAALAEDAVAAFERFVR